MSFIITEHRCARCNGHYERWEHNESGEVYLHHDLGMQNKKLKPLCSCTHVKEENQNEKNKEN